MVFTSYHKPRAPPQQPAAQVATAWNAPTPRWAPALRIGRALHVTTAPWRDMLPRRRAGRGFFMEK